MPNPPILLPPTLRATVLAGAGLLALATGCDRDRVGHYRVPKEAPAPHPDHPGHELHAQTPGLPPAGASAGKPASQGALKWSLPKGWSETPGEGMRFASFKAPIPGRLETTVVVLPGPAGGELANVNRWRNQIQLGPIDEPALAAARQVIRTKAGAVNVYDFTSEGPAKSRMVAGLIATPDGNTWFLKMTGDADAVAKAKPDFMSILGSLRLD